MNGNGKFHSQIPNFWGPDGNASEKFLSQLSGTGMQEGNSISNFRERELAASIPGNDRVPEFPLTPEIVAFCSRVMDFQSRVGQVEKTDENN